MTEAHQLNSGRVSKSGRILSSAPSVRFVGIRWYARYSGEIQIPVQASDDIGVTRIELYVDQNLVATYNISPSTPTASVVFNWNTAGFANGKHIIISKAYDTENNVQSSFTILFARNFITAPVGNSIILNAAIAYQTMGGWEATDQSGQLFSPAWNNYKNTLLDQAVNDLGINRIRLEINSGTENPIDYFAQWRAGQITENQYNATRAQIVNDNADPNIINPAGFKWSALDSTIDNIVIPMRQRMQARGESLWVNVCYVDFGSSTFEHKDNPAEYAEFVLATYQHMQSRYGFVPNSWEVVLEPDNTTSSWSASQVAQAIKAAGDKLVANGFIPNFVAPSNLDALGLVSFVDAIAQMPGAMQYVSEFSYHRYGNSTLGVIQNIAARTVLYNKRSAMLEWIGADYNTLHEDIKYGRNSSWQQYCIAGPISWGGDNGDRYYLIDDTNVSNPLVIMGSRTKFLRQYFKFIRFGARRIDAVTGNPNFDPLAFINTNGKYVVVVKAISGGAFSLQGLPAGTYGIKYTTFNQYNVDLADAVISAGQTLSASIPSAGVITIYGR